MIYIKGTITPVVTSPKEKTIYGYQCSIRTPGMQVSKISTRSRMEALTEALKLIGLPMK